MEATIKASQFETPLLIASESVDFDKAIKSWVLNQDKHWPKDLSANILIENIVCVYASYWIVNASASCRWSASIGVANVKQVVCSSCNGKKTNWTDCRRCHGRGTVDQKQQGVANVKQIICSSCNGKKGSWADCRRCHGRGTVDQEEIIWNSQQGIANVENDKYLIPNIATENIDCGQRDLNSIKILLQPILSEINVLYPIGIDEHSANKRAEGYVVKALKNNANYVASTIGIVQDLRVGYLNIAQMSFVNLLYPLFIGFYTFKDQEHLKIQMDGITGEVFVQIPSSIENARLEEQQRIERAQQIEQQRIERAQQVEQQHIKRVQLVKKLKYLCIILTSIGLFAGLVHLYTVKATIHRYHEFIKKHPNIQIEPKMVDIPGGKFLMGCSQGDTECSDSEKPAHWVNLSAFKMSVTKVTVEAWGAYLDACPAEISSNHQPSLPRGGPVVNVSWEDAQAYIFWLNRVTGKRYSLPTEAQWEYVFRAGDIATYAFNTIAEQNDALSSDLSIILSFPPNSWGVRDMCGGYQEWCQDWYHTYSETEVTNPEGPSSGNIYSDRRVIRGRSLRFSHRSGDYSMMVAGEPNGFRLVLPPDH